MLQEKLTDLPQSRKNPNTDRPVPIRADQTDQLQSRTTLVSTSTTNCSHPAQSMSTALSLLTSTDRVTHFSKQQLEAWTQQYSPWLYLNGNNVGCTFCKYAKRLFGVQKGGQVAEEWASGEVTAKDVRAMRKKIYKHRDSLTHKASTDIQQQKEKEVLPTLTETLNAKVEKLAFSKMYGLVELQEMNGVKNVSCHKSDHSCINIITHIANKMRKKIVSTIKSAGSWICLTVDESTAFGRSYLILYLRGDVTGEGETENIFLDLIELEEGTTADAIYKALKKSLQEADLDDAYLKSHLICITTDGASVMTGRQSGLVTRLKKDYPLLESIHCLAHRLELSVSDALKSVTGCNHFEIFISKLYTLYHQSPKNAR
ncbi:E3 SUMO-protein ligase KIAA1586-like [Carassius carassius]|uniref:E3 SUMO-protein ligase KIAA1586-like n=1 Tax=Carassius carassius TaxID=217509 RepID=UPI0028695B68|nr:E3 SUMO-protein ligase KIAA1586-like [Carassius carassius]